MTITQIAADLLVSQQQVQRLMAMRSHFRHQMPVPTPEFWAHWAWAIETQVEQVRLLSGWLTHWSAANDARMEVPA